MLMVKNVNDSTRLTFGVSCALNVCSFNNHCVGKDDTIPVSVSLGTKYIFGRCRPKESQYCHLVGSRS